MSPETAKALAGIFGVVALVIGVLIVVLLEGWRAGDHHEARHRSTVIADAWRQIAARLAIAERANFRLRSAVTGAMASVQAFTAAHAAERRRQG